MVQYNEPEFGLGGQLMPVKEYTLTQLGMVVSCNSQELTPVEKRVRKFYAATKMRL